MFRFLSLALATALIVACEDTSAKHYPDPLQPDCYTTVEAGIVTPDHCDLDGDGHNSTIH